MPICAPRRETEKRAIVSLCACRGEAVLVLPEDHRKPAESFCHDGYLEVTHFNSTFIFLWWAGGEVGGIVLARRRDRGVMFLMAFGLNLPFTVNVVGCVLVRHVFLPLPAPPLLTTCSALAVCISGL